MKEFNVTVRRTISYDQDIYFKVNAEDELDAIKKFMENAEFHRGVSVDHEDIEADGYDDGEEYPEANGISISDDDNSSEEWCGTWDLPSDNEELYKEVEEYMKELKEEEEED